MLDETQIDRYKILSFIGRGGMASVYKALDERLEREVALKIISPHLTVDDKFIHRFRREAQLVAQLDHPHIIKVYDSGSYKGRPYLIMQLVTGGTLEDRIEEGPLPITALMPMLAQIGYALDVAHGKRIVHRDLKPSNILFDDQGRAFISDFGIAKRIDSDTKLTGTQNAIGTARYMSPEQVRALPVDGLSDQYSFGVVAFEALTGRPLFEGDTVQVAMKHVSQPPPLHTLPADVPNRVRSGLQRALSKDPKERFRSLADFVTAIGADRYYRASSIFSRPPLPETMDDVTAIDVRMPDEFEIEERTATLDSLSIDSKTEIQPTPIPEPRYEPREEAVAPPPPPRRRGRWIGGISVLALIAAAVFGWLNFGNQLDLPFLAPTPTSVPAVVEEAPVLEEEVVVEETILTVSGGTSRAVLRLGDELVPIPADGRLALTLPIETNLLQTGSRPLTIETDNGSLIQLEENSAISLQILSEDETELLLDEGAVLIEPGDGVEAQISDTEGSLIESDDGLIGANLNLVRGEIEFNCVTGTCTVKDAGANQFFLDGGDGIAYINGGTDGETFPVRYESYAGLSPAVPTPTHTPTMTETPSPTATDAPATETPTPTSSPDDGNETPEATETPTPTSTPTSTPTPVQASGPAQSGGGFPISFDGAAFGTWVRGDEENGTISQSSAVAFSGSSAAISYDFNTSGNDYVVFLQTNSISGTPGTISAQVFGDGSGHFLNLWIRDSDGQTWQLPLGRVTHTGWRQMTGELTTDQDWPWTHISGNNDGEIDFPITFRGIVLDDGSDSYTGSGTIYIDEISVGGSAVAASPTTASSGGSTSSGSTDSGTSVEPFDGDLGRIVYTSGNLIMTTDPTWSSPKEVGTAAANTCTGTPSTVTGQVIPTTTGSPACNLAEGTVVCASPNGAYEIIFNGSFGGGGFDLTIRPAGADTGGDFILRSNEFDISEPLRWSPSSDSYIFVFQDTLYIGFLDRSYRAIASPIYNPYYAPEGDYILFRKPIGPGVNDVFVTTLDGSVQSNVTNVSTVDKSCAVWTR